MAGPLRIEYENAIYPLTSRGNARQPIVRDDVDRHKWMQLLQRTVDEHRWRLFAFALMTNHYHWSKAATTMRRFLNSQPCEPAPASTRL